MATNFHRGMLGKVASEGTPLPLRGTLNFEGLDSRSDPDGWTFEVPIATEEEALAGASTRALITPATLAPAIAAAVPAATTEVAGKVELATTGEANAGTDTTRAVTPAGLAAYCPAASESAAGKAELATQAEVNAGTDAARVLTPATHALAVPNQYRLTDRFNGITTTGLLGDLHWRWGSSAGTPSVFTSESAGRFGNFQVVTGGTSGNDNRIFLSTTPDLGIVDPENLLYGSWVVSVSSVSNINARLGLLSSLGSAVGASGLYFEYDPDVSAVWRLILRTASTDTTISSGVTVVSSSYYWLECKRNGASIEFWLNGSLVGSSAASNMGTGTPLALGARVATATGATRFITLDDMDYIWTRPQRWT